MNNKYNILILMAVFGAGFLFNACDATKFLQEGETFTGIDKITIKSRGRIENKSYLSSELHGFIKQKRNRNRLNVWSYYANRDSGDTLWYNNFIRKFIAEEPSILDEEIVRSTALEMEEFLRNKRGFYNAEVRYKLHYHPRFNETGVEYIVQGGKRYYIKSVSFTSEDTSLLQLMTDHADKSFLISGNPVSSLDFDLEKNRLTNLFQNNGYSQFLPDYIELTGDSSNYLADLIVNVLNYDDDNMHPRFVTGKIDVYTDFNPAKASAPMMTEVIDSLHFIRRFSEFLVEPEVIASKISLHQGELTNKSRQQETYNRLSQLSPYKFVMFRQNPDSLKADQINYDILLIPKPNLWATEYGLELNYTTLSQDDQLFGFGGNFSIENNNLFGGAERYVSTFSANTDLRLFKLYESFLTNSNSIIFPKPIKWHNYAAFYPIFKFVLPGQYSRFSQYAQSRVSVNAFYHNLFETFNIFTANATLGYQYKSGEKTMIHLDQFTIDYHTAQIFNESLFNEPYIKNSLSPYLLTGFLFDDIAISVQNNRLNRRFSWNINAGLEFSGHEIYLLNKLYNQLSNTDDFWVLDFNEGTKFAKYFKTHFEYRNRYIFSTGSSLASRLLFGFGIPFGDNTILPYTKQFYSGGPQSLRAWPSRGIGPGGHAEPVLTDDQVAFQKGDIKLEANIEYRFNMPWYFEGAFFVDAGNIWLFNDDPKLLNAQFTKTFYKQIAVGAGYGLRLNFNFLIVRIDIGHKLRLPYIDPQTQSQWVGLSRILRGPNPTFGLDYSF